MGKVTPLPYVEEHEVAEAKSIIDQQFIEMTGKPFGFRPAGFNIVVKIFVRPDELTQIKMPDGTTKTLWTAPIMQKQDEFESVTALVCAVGPLAFKDRITGEPWAEGPWARVGDWIAIPRMSSWLTNYRGVSLAVLPDDKIIAIVEDPADLTSVYVAPRV